MLQQCRRVDRTRTIVRAAGAIHIYGGIALRTPVPAWWRAAAVAACRLLSASERPRVTELLGIERGITARRAVMELSAKPPRLGLLDGGAGAAADKSRIVTSTPT